jgi:hypothetical protein
LPQYFFNGKSIQAAKINLQGEMTKYREGARGRINDWISK